MSERKDDYAVECFIRSYEKHPLNTADSAVPELLRELLELRAAVKTMREALTRIACYEDIGANLHLERHNSFAEFDEPGSAYIARVALTGAHKDMTGGGS